MNNHGLPQNTHGLGKKKQYFLFLTILISLSLPVCPYQSTHISLPISACPYQSVITSLSLSVCCYQSVLISLSLSVYPLQCPFQAFLFSVLANVAVAACCFNNVRMKLSNREWYCVLVMSWLVGSFEGNDLYNKEPLCSLEEKKSQYFLTMSSERLTLCEHHYQISF